MKVLLIIPPFTQINTPYPATMQLAGFLQSKGYDAESFDLSLEVTLKMFSARGLKRIFDAVNTDKKLDKPTSKILVERNKYEDVIETVVKYLQSKNKKLEQRVLAKNFLPHGESFKNIYDKKKSFGYIEGTDKAKHLCSLVIDDLTKFIQKNITPHFGLSRYAENTAVSPPYFDPLLKELNREPNIIEKIIFEETKKIMERVKPGIVGFTIPFPGNFLGALIPAKFIKKKYPEIKIIFGGGYVNTELRSLTDIRLFDYCDYITYDDGELPLLNILRNVEREIMSAECVRTRIRKNGQLTYIDNSPVKNILHDELVAPSLSGIHPQKYISMVEMLNPMHRLWSDGYWNKITVAHGCYWHRCTFCDTTLDYIDRYSPASAVRIVDWIESLIEQSGCNSFHFTDEAAPPALLKEISLEILRRKLRITWWGNIRFEKAYTYDLCKLMSAAGCIAVSGGIEVADDRLLKLINKGVTIEQAAVACYNFQKANIMVHSYLMYGFPTQTEQETINSLEMVRQFMSCGLFQSAFWHLFTLTVHSPIAKEPQKYCIEIESSLKNPFASDNLVHRDKSGIDHKKFSAGLNKALYNYMHGIGLDWDVREWFEFPVRRTSVRNNLIKNILKEDSPSKIGDHSRAVWLGEKPEMISKGNGKIELVVRNSEVEGAWELNTTEAEWLNNFIIETMKINSKTYADWKKSFYGDEKKFEKFLQSDTGQELREYFLLFV